MTKAKAQISNECQMTNVKKYGIISGSKFNGSRFKVDIAAKRHKIHKNNNLDIGISDSYGHQKHKFGLFTTA